MSTKLLSAFTVFSEAINVLLFKGDPHETLSSRSYRQGVLEGSTKWLWTMRIINTIFFWSKDHCKNSYDYELASADVLEKDKPK